MQLHKVSILLVISLLAFTAKSQKVIKASDIAKTQWMSGDMPKQSSQSYYFKIVTSSGSSLKEAQDNAFAALLIELGNAQGVKISSKSIHEIKTESDNSSYKEQETTQHSYSIERDGLKASFDKVDEYWELVQSDNSTTKYNLWVLYAVANNPEKYNFDKIKFTSEYKMSAVWRSALVPGWGQFYKKNKKKGIVILSSELVLVSGFFVADNLRASYNQKALDTKNITLRRSYIKNADTFKLVRNSVGIASVAVYVYNIVDVLTAKGAKHYASADTKRFQMYPDANKDYIGFACNFRF
ncbi:MAG: hypothetical protein JXR60_00125 [Bacteroidales bacterium]|nr:hypothetical protein [Bacteroidales bacterium]